MQRKKLLFTTQAAMIAALYVILTYLAAAFGLSSGAVQIRFSEALTVLPFFTPSAIPGLFIGCLLSNLLTGACLIDIIFGSLATLGAAYIPYRIRRFPFLVPIPPIAVNTIVSPFVLKYGYGMTENAIPYMMLTVGAGEIISCGILGTCLLMILKRYPLKIFYIFDGHSL